MNISINNKRNGVSINASLNDGSFPKFTENLKRFLNDPKGSHTAEAVETLGRDMLDSWSDSARRSLKSSESYINALEEGNKPQFNGNPLEYVITQDQRTRDGSKSIAIIMEYGIEPFDMKQKILKGRQKVVVKFDYGSPSQSRNKKLPKEIFNVMRSRMDRTKTITIGGDSYTKYTMYHSHIKEAYGEEIANKVNPRKEKFLTIMPKNPANLPPGQGGVRTGSGRYAFSVAYKWKTREFDGLKAEVTKSGKRTEINKYSAFRTISANSDPHSWIHPGIIPKYIFRNALDSHLPKIRPVLEQALELDLNPS